MKRTVFCGQGWVWAWTGATAVATQKAKAISRVTMDMTLHSVMPGFRPGIHVLLFQV